jgi:hypothetical protein
MSLAQLPAEPIVELFRGFAAFLPRLLAGLVLVLLGWGVGRLSSLLAVRLLQGWGGRMTRGLGRLLGRPAAEREAGALALERPVADAVGSVFFWLVFLLFVAAATEALGLPVVSAWLSGVAAYLPRLLVAALIVGLGFLAGGLARTAIAGATASAGFGYADAMGRMAQVIVVMASSIVAFDQLGVAITFLTVLAAIVTAALLGGAALAFGLGARTAVSNIIAAHYLLKIYRVGHHVRVGGFEGRIVDITPTAVVIATAEGQAVVPAKEFSEHASLLLTT